MGSDTRGYGSNIYISTAEVLLDKIYPWKNRMVPGTRGGPQIGKIIFFSPEKLQLQTVRIHNQNLLVGYMRLPITASSNKPRF